MNPNKYKNYCLSLLKFAEDKPFNQKQIIEREQVLILISIIRNLICTPENIAKYTHDIWSAFLFRDGFMYSDKTDIMNKTHILLIPYSELPDKQTELKLASLDLEGIEQALVTYFNLNNEKNTTKHLLDKEKITSTISRLSVNSQFIDLVASNVHDSWRKIKRETGITSSEDPRIGTSFPNLSDEMKRVSKQNAKADLLSIILYLNSNEIL